MEKAASNANLRISDLFLRELTERRHQLAEKVPVSSKRAMVGHRKTIVADSAPMSFTRQGPHVMQEGYLGESILEPVIIQMLFPFGAYEARLEQARHMIRRQANLARS